MKAIFLFYLPLALPALMMSASHAIIMSSLTRLPDAATIIAAFTLASGVAMVMEAPVVPGRQLVIALVKDRLGWRAALRALLLFGLPLSLLTLLLAFPPVGRPVLSRLFNVPDGLMAPTLAAYAIMGLLTPFGIYRFLIHGLVIVRRRPVYLTAAMAARIPLMSLIAYGTVTWGWIPPIYAGPTILMAGISLEMLIVWVGARRARAELPAESDQPPPTAAGALRLLLPLSGAHLLWTAGRPAINAALGSSDHAEAALATLGISNLVMYAMLGLLLVLNQVTAVHGTDAAGRRLVLRFSIGAGVIMTVLVGLLGFTAAGSSLLLSLLRVPAHLHEPFVTVVRTMIAWPLLVAGAEYLQGIWLLNRNTRLISLARTLSLLVSVGSAYLLVRHATSAGGLAAVAIGASIAGTAVELAVMSAPLLWRRRAGVRLPA